MTRIFKSKLVRIIFIIGLLGSAVLIVINYSQIQNYQIKFRNDERKKELDSISSGLKSYVTIQNTCPRTNIPSSQSFLPELIIDDNTPEGGVNVASLEGVERYFDKTQKDPSGDPYFTGIYDNLIYIYTNDYEESSTSKRVYYVTVEASLCNQVVQ